MSSIRQYYILELDGWHFQLSLKFVRFFLPGRRPLAKTYGARAIPILNTVVGLAVEFRAICNVTSTYSPSKGSWAPAD